MSTTTSQSPVTTPPPVGPSTSTPLWRWAAAFAASWLLPAGTHLLGADWLLPPILLVGLMSLQRPGRTLLDRFVLAAAQLFGALCAAGLVISVWPWHLHPVPIAGCAFTGLVVLALVTGRRPRLPRRPPAADVVTWLAGLAVAVLAFGPFALRDLGGRMGIVAPGEDFARHFMLYDMIGKVGGYAFLHRPAAGVFAPDDYGFGYPQGTHLLYAVLDRFVRSSDRNADAVTAMDVALWCHLGSYVFLALALLWAVRRVAGPAPAPAALLAVLGGVAGVLYFGDLITVFLRGFPNELLGLALVAMLTAVVARPLAGVRDQVVTVASLLIGVSFTYHLYLPYALVVAAVWAWRRRRALPWRFTLAVAVVLAPLVVITPLANRPSGSGNQLLIPGTALPVDRPVLCLVLIAALAGISARYGWRSPARRVLAVELAVAAGMVVALWAYQYAMVGHSVYYFEKLLHMLLVVGLVALGTTARLLPWSRVARPSAGRYATALAGVLVVAFALAAFGGPWHAKPLAGAGLRYGLGLEKGSPAGGRQAVNLVRDYPDANGTVDVVLTATPYANFYATLFTAVMQRNYRVGEAWYVFLSPSAPHRPTLADLEARVRDSPVPVRFVVRDPDARFFAAEPGSSSAAPTNVEVARTLAGRYPSKVGILVLGA
ncbi:hypothetical protein [Planosporangium mesophilum]|uniref:Uncharacterized protein n=1 Tax=Planosporangium mesophilum TaxID=689768 RepID=A0A8J3TAD9_9ACTN|nr:hypothetical protein [Planosporangium mesophilum]NJC82198.1 hypothetical protein [Planosporangium mesophilum]GII22247.1 hypothetical protein Pme01_18440 [Planosporangium mesophilum]